MQAQRCYEAKLAESLDKQSPKQFGLPDIMLASFHHRFHWAGLRYPGPVRNRTVPRCCHVLKSLSMLIGISVATVAAIAAMISMYLILIDHEGNRP
jgi:hypothetical protein